MKIVETLIGDLKPYPGNPRHHTTWAISKMAKVIEEFGWQQPLVADTEGVLVVGHRRYLAARQLGLKTVPVVFAPDLSPPQIQALRLLDNRLDEDSTWDETLLAAELTALAGMDYIMAMTGFSDKELERLMSGLTAVGADDPVEVPPVTLQCPRCGKPV